MPAGATPAHPTHLLPTPAPGRRREEDRARAARYSAAQEAARRAAAEALAARQDGWFDRFAHKFGISNMGARAASAMENAVFGASYSSGAPGCGGPEAGGCL